MFKTKTLLAASCLLATAVSAAPFNISMGVSGTVNQLAVKTAQAFSFPFATNGTGDAQGFTVATATSQANDAFIAAATTSQGTLAIANKDATRFDRFSFWLNADFNYDEGTAFTVSLNAVAGGKNTAFMGGLLNLEPTIGFGGCGGLKMNGDGHSAEMGACANVFRADITSGPLPTALLNAVGISDDGGGGVATEATIATGFAAATAKINNLVLPSLYLKATMDAGDLARVFARASMSLNRDLELKEVSTAGPQVFGGVADTFGTYFKVQSIEASAGFEFALDAFLGGGDSDSNR